MRRQILCGVLVMIAASGCRTLHITGPKPLPVPLASMAPDTHQWDRPAGLYEPVLQHMIPGATYFISYGETYEEVTKPAPPQGSVAVQSIDGCAPPDFTKLIGAATEQEVKKESDRLLADAEEKCRAPLRTAIDILTTHRFEEIRLRPKFLRTISIHRVKNSSERKWAVNLRTGPGATWETMTVLALVDSNEKDWITLPETVTNDEGVEQQLFRLVEEDGGEFRPGVGAGFFLIPEFARSMNYFAPSFMAGFGLSDTKAPIMFMTGVGLLFGDHVSISLGASGTWERELLDRYKGLSHVPSALTTEQLTDEEEKLRFFVSIGIDFDGFDFSRGRESSEE